MIHIHIDIFITPPVLYTLMFGISGICALTFIFSRKVSNNTDEISTDVSSECYFASDEDDDDDEPSTTAQSKKRKVDDAELCEFRNKMEDCLQAIKERNGDTIIELLSEYDGIEVRGTENADRHWVYSKLHNDVMAYSYKLADSDEKILVMRATTVAF